MFGKCRGLVGPTPCHHHSRNDVSGGFAAMYEDGYGVCYSIQEETLKFNITSNPVRTHARPLLCLPM